MSYDKLKKFFFDEEALMTVEEKTYKYTQHSE